MTVDVAVLHPVTHSSPPSGTSRERASQEEDLP